jgi:hypothetical protein
MHKLMMLLLFLAVGCGDGQVSILDADLDKGDVDVADSDLGNNVRPDEGFVDLGPDANPDGVSLAVAGSPWVMCKNSGDNAASPNVLADAQFSITLSAPERIQTVQFSLHHDSTGWQEPSAAWELPGPQITHAAGLGLAGVWQARAIATLTDGTTVESNHHPVECRAKRLSVGASNPSPQVGENITLTAACDYGCEYPYAAAQWFYNAGAGWVADAAVNPHTHNATGAISWLWQERFEDGSVINSSAVAVTPVAAGPTYDITPGTYSGANITAALQGKATFTWAPGDYTITSQFFIPSNVYITATGANIKLTGGAIKNVAPADCGVVGDNHYTHAGGFTWDGGTIYRDAGDTLMSFAHAPSLTIKNVTFYRYAASNNTGHAIEVNSSGGPNLGTSSNAGTGPYTVRIINNRFLGTDQGQRSNSNDEPIQYDWAYSTGAAAAKVCPNQSDVLASTMCHNVEISGNTFHRVAETGGWQFGLCAIGGHKSADNIVGTRRLPKNRHNNFLIANNEIHGAVGSTGTNPDKGAIHVTPVHVNQ